MKKLDFYRFHSLKLSAVQTGWLADFPAVSHGIATRE